MTGGRGSRGTVVVLAWLGAAVLTGTVAWNAVAVLSDESPRTGVMSQDEVTAALATARATTTADPATSPSPSSTTTAGPTASPSPTTTPTPSASPTPSPTRTTTTEPRPTSTSSSTSTPRPTTSTSTPPPDPGPSTVAATWKVTGGTVSVECTGSRIALLFATPQDGWTVEIGSRGPEQVEVELHRSEQETKLVARCSDGAPVRSVTTEGEDHEEESEDD